MMRTVKGAALALVLFWPRAGAADEPPAEGETAPAPEVLEVRVIGERADALQRIPGSGTLLGAKEVRRAAPADVGELLVRVPGVHVRQETGAGGRLDVGVRGLDPGRGRRVLVLEDGIPVAINPYAEPDLYYAPPVERVRGVEVVKGSGSILFGPQTIGGVINFATLPVPDRQAAAAEVKVGERRFVELLASYGNSHAGARYLVQGFFARGDGFREEGFDTLDLFGKLAFETSRDGELTIKLAIHEHRAHADDVGLTSAMYAADPRRATLAPDDELVLNRWDIALLHEQRFSAETKLRTLAYAYWTDRVWRRQEYHRFPVAAERYVRIVGDPEVPGGAIYFLDRNRVLDRRYHVLGLEPRLEQRFATAGVGHTVDVGGRVLVEGAHYEQRIGERPTSYAGASELDETRRTLAFAGYLQDRIAFRDELLVTPGVRVEHVRYARAIARRPEGGTPRDVDIEGESDVTAVVPGIGMVVGTPQLNVFGGFHVGFAPPRITASINPEGETTALDAEEALHYEVGARAKPARWLALEATGFLSSFFNQIVASTDPDAPTELVNAGRTCHAGLEAAGSVELGRALALPVGIDVIARYTLLDARFAGGPLDGNLLPYAPSHKVGTVLDVEHDVGVGAEVAWTYVGPFFADDANTVAEDVTGRLGLVPGYHLLDAGVRYRHAASGLGARVTAKSLLDDAHIVARRPEGIFAGGFRQITASLRWELP
jgi:Fe(3+) dicitrate transport protein